MPKLLASRIWYWKVCIKLDTTELVPPPGHAVIALQYRKFDSDTEVVLQQIHHKNTLRCCNIERETQREISDETAKNRLGVYCAEDENGNYHAAIAWINALEKQLNFAKISQNTRHSLAQNIVKKINSFT